jgi:hypothetical protein
MTRRFMTVVFVCLALCFMAISNHDARAAWPPDETAGPVDYKNPSNWPNDPEFAGLWQYHSFVPDRIFGQVDEVTKRLGTGAHYDRAWAKTTGDPNVIIAMTDSGIEWNNVHLLNRMFINKGELPVSECPAGTGANGHDRNGDGRFNVQDYTTATGHDLPEFTKVCDSRITTDHNKNGVLDAEDLIKTFSDGKDDDGNGYTDDISGWDFFQNDNNPADNTHFGHGTGASRDSAAEGNDGRGDIGTCPDCSLMMLRCGDAFVPEVNNWSMAVVYATDIGAHVVNMSGGGGLSNPAFVRDALEYAYDNGVSVVISNSDLNSFHHNMPNHNNHAIAVHAIVHDGTNPESSSTFFNYNNCTNYGANLFLSIPANGCSSEASGRSGGMLGLLYSAAIKYGIPQPYPMAGDPAGTRRLTAEEVRQLLLGTVDSFYNPADATNPEKYPTKPGFARRFGYGRPNPRTAIDQIVAGKLPPEVDLETPLWYDTLYPDQTPTVPIVGRIALRGAAQNPAGTTFDYVVEWAPGVDPVDGEFKQIGKGDMLSSSIAGPLAMWNLQGIEVRNPVPGRKDPSFQPDDPVNIYTVTLRVRATVHSSNPMLEGVKGESRKAVHIHRDSTLLPGFPKWLGASGEASPKLADIDGDGKREIIVADSSGRVHAFRMDGSELPGWPARVELLPLVDPNSKHGKGHQMAPAFTMGQKPINASDIGSPIGATPAVGDLDGDGKLEVVVATWNGHVWAFRSNGQPVTGFPVTMRLDSDMYTVDRQYELEDGFWGAPLLADLDGDKKPEIVAAGMDARLYAWKANGQEVPGYPVVVWDTTRPEQGDADDKRQRQRIFTTPACGDLNGDGIPDFVTGTNENYTGHGRVYAIDGRGNNTPGGNAFLPGFPIDIVSTRILPVVGQGSPISPVLADVDADGVPEIIINGITSVPKVYNSKGKSVGRPMVNQKQNFGELSDALNPVIFTFVSYPAIADLDDDGVPDIVEGAAGTDAALSFASGGKRRDFEHHVGAWDSRTGAFKRGYPRVLDDWMFFATPAIADIDGDGKVNVLAASGGYFVHAWDVDGKEAAGFPKFTGGWVLATPAVADLDGDGKLELVVNTRNGWLYAWRTEGPADGRVDWSSFHRDLANTGNYELPNEFGKKAVPQAAGCACDVAARRTGGFMLPLIALSLAVWVVRRRRSA